MMAPLDRTTRKGMSVAAATAASLRATAFDADGAATPTDASLIAWLWFPIFYLFCR